MGWFTDLVSDFGAGIADAGSSAFDYFTNPEIVAELGSEGLQSFLMDRGYNQAQIPPSGYQGGIPTLRAVRGEVPMMRGEELSDGTIRPVDQTGVAGLAGAQPTGRMLDMSYDPNRRPGSSGRRYFSDVQYVKEGEDLAAAQARMQEQATALAEQNIANPARERRQPPQQMAAGGIAALKKGKYLNGDTDGMADEVPASIEGRQPAALSDGEFVIPADVVSHLGNGNSDAGAKVLEEMMARVRKARTGRKEQGKEIKAPKMLPA